MLAFNYQSSCSGVFVGRVSSGRQLQVCRLTGWPEKHTSPFNDCGKLRV